MQVVKCKYAGLATNIDGNFVARKIRCRDHVAVLMGLFAVETEPRNKHCAAEGMYRRQRCAGVEGTFTPDK